MYSARRRLGEISPTSSRSRHRSFNRRSSDHYHQSGSNHDRDSYYPSASEMEYHDSYSRNYDRRMSMMDSPRRRSASPTRDHSRSRSRSSRRRRRRSDKDEYRDDYRSSHHHSPHVSGSKPSSPPQESEDYDSHNRRNNGQNYISSRPAYAFGRYPCISKIDPSIDRPPPINGPTINIVLSVCDWDGRTLDEIKCKVLRKASLRDLKLTLYHEFGVDCCLTKPPHKSDPRRSRDSKRDSVDDSEVLYEIMVNGVGLGCVRDSETCLSLRLRQHSADVRLHRCHRPMNKESSLNTMMSEDTKERESRAGSLTSFTADEMAEMDRSNPANSQLVSGIERSQAVTNSPTVADNHFIIRTQCAQILTRLCKVIDECGVSETGKLMSEVVGSDDSAETLTVLLEQVGSVLYSEKDNDSNVDCTALAAEFRTLIRTYIEIGGKSLSDPLILPVNEDSTKMKSTADKLCSLTNELKALEFPSSWQPPGIDDDHAVFVGDLPRTVTELQLRLVFESISTVGWIHLFDCSHMQRPFNFAFVYYSDKSAVPTAIDTLNFTKFNGQACRVMAKHGSSTWSESSTNIVVKNLAKNTTTEQLYKVFSVFGKIRSAKVKTGLNGVLLSYGYVQYATRDSASKAIDTCAQGLVVMGTNKLTAEWFKSKVRRGSSDVLSSVVSSASSSVGVSSMTTSTTDGSGILFPSSMSSSSSAAHFNGGFQSTSMHSSHPFMVYGTPVRSTMASMVPSSIMDQPRNRSSFVNTHPNVISQHQVYVKNIPLHWGDEELVHLFESCVNCKIESHSVRLSQYGKWACLSFTPTLEIPDPVAVAVARLNNLATKDPKFPILGVSRFVPRNQREQVKRQERQRIEFGFSLYCGNLPNSFEEVQLTELFAPFGGVVSTSIFQKTPDFKFGFINFSNAQSAGRALVALDGRRLFDRVLQVKCSTKDVTNSNLIAAAAAEAMKATAETQSKLHALSQALTLKLESSNASAMNSHSVVPPSAAAVSSVLALAAAAAAANHGSGAAVLAGSAWKYLALDGSWNICNHSISNNLNALSIGTQTVININNNHYTLKRLDETNGLQIDQQTGQICKLQRA